MPGVLVLFFTLVGLTSADTLLLHEHAIWRGVDPTARTTHGTLNRGFYSTMSVTAVTLAHRDVYGKESCKASIFSFEGNWQETQEVEAGLSHRMYVAVHHPSGCYEQTFMCVPETWDGRTLAEEGTRCE